VEEPPGRTLATLRRASYESYLITPEEFIDAGDQVLMLVHVRARTIRDGVGVEHAPAALFEVRDGRIHRARFFLERALALAAAGMEPPPAGGWRSYHWGT